MGDRADEDMMLSGRINLREATVSDSQMILSWRNDPFIVSLSSSQRVISFEEHNAWFQKVLKSNSVKIYIIQQGEIPVGQVRFDKSEDQANAVISIYLLKEHTGKGSGVEAMHLACEAINKTWPGLPVLACVRGDNERGRKAFIKAGFTETTASGCPADHTALIR